MHTACTEVQICTPCTLHFNTNVQTVCTAHKCYNKCAQRPDVHFLFCSLQWSFHSTRIGGTVGNGNYIAQIAHHPVHSAQIAHRTARWSKSDGTRRASANLEIRGAGLSSSLSGSFSSSSLRLSLSSPPPPLWSAAESSLRTERWWHFVWIFKFAIMGKRILERKHQNEWRHLRWQWWCR